MACCDVECNLKRRARDLGITGKRPNREVMPSIANFSSNYGVPLLGGTALQWSDRPLPNLRSSVRWITILGVTITLPLLPYTNIQGLSPAVRTSARNSRSTPPGDDRGPGWLSGRASLR